jgi:hypothetical protein
VNVIDHSTRDISKQLNGVIVTERRLKATQVAEHHGTEPGGPLIAIDERVIFRHGVQKGRSLEFDSLVGVLAKGTSSGSIDRRIQKTEVTNRANLQVLNDRYDIVKREVLRVAHSVRSRSKTSPHRAVIRLMESATSPS